MIRPSLFLKNKTVHIKSGLKGQVYSCPLTPSKGTFHQLGTAEGSITGLSRNISRQKLGSKGHLNLAISRLVATWPL